MTKDPVRSVPTVARRERRPKSRSVDAGAIARPLTVFVRGVDRSEGARDGGRSSAEEPRKVLFENRRSPIFEKEKSYLKIGLSRGS